MASFTLLENAFLLWFICCAVIPSLTAQLMWTPIYVEGNSQNQIDLWTREAKGCSCPWNRTDYHCACCVLNGGCHCGKAAPNRCTQCGFEEYCNHMCNMTIVLTELMAKSGKSFGQIKSPSLEGPGVCWYTFIPSPAQRVELQIYRLINVGKHNGTSCVGGFLQLSNGAEVQHNPSDNQICGNNERFAPPVVFFSDGDVSTLLFQITEQTKRSQFLAYFSFTPIKNNNGLGYQPRGGMQLQNTDCDWLYQDFECNKFEENVGTCILASPGYPGVYPPHRQCRYHITTSDEKVGIRISFTALQLPESCITDYISIYKGTTTSSPLLTTLCGHQRKTFEYSGLNLLIQFSTGSQDPPFNFNGFVASVKFFPKLLTTESTHLAPQTSISTQPFFPALETSVLSTSETLGCDIIISGNNTRSGHFDTREHEWCSICRLIFQGRTTDVVHVTLFNYRLRTPLCKASIEVSDTNINNNRIVLDKICSPAVTQLQKQDDKFVKQKNFLSQSHVITITVKRSNAPLTTNDAEFLTGAFFFHDEQISGTMQPDKICDVNFYGQQSPLAGTIYNPGAQHLYWTANGSLSCKHQFFPSTNQSIVVKIQNIERMSIDSNCVTQCGDNGCRCVSSKSLLSTDHLLLVGDNNLTIACICGDFQAEGLPVSVRTWGSLTVAYFVSHYTWSTKGFEFSASYAFNTDYTCGEHIYTMHSGEIFIRNLTSPENLNHFYQQSCTWTLHSNVERQLVLDISSNQNRPCVSWNISIYEYSSNSNNQHLGELISTFCSRENHKQFLLPWKLNTVIVKLLTVSRTLPQFIIKWKTQIVRPNTRFIGAPSAIPNAISSTDYPKPSTINVLYMLSMLCLWCKPKKLSR